MPFGRNMRVQMREVRVSVEVEEEAKGRAEGNVENSRASGQSSSDTHHIRYARDLNTQMEMQIQGVRADAQFILGIAGLDGSRSSAESAMSCSLSR